MGGNGWTPISKYVHKALGGIVIPAFGDRFGLRIHSFTSKAQGMRIRALDIDVLKDPVYKEAFRTALGYINTRNYGGIRLEVKNGDLFDEYIWQGVRSNLAWFEAVTGEGKDDLCYPNEDCTEAVKTDGTGILGDDNKMKNLARWIDCEEPPKGRIFELGWVCAVHYLGKPLFSFDRKKILSFPRDCAKVTPAQLKLALDVFGLQIARSCNDSDFSGECLEVWKKWCADTVYALDAGKE